MNIQELDTLIDSLRNMIPVEAYLHGKGEGYWQGWDDHKKGKTEPPKTDGLWVCNSRDLYPECKISTCGILRTDNPMTKGCPIDKNSHYIPYVSECDLKKDV